LAPQRNSELSFDQFLAPCAVATVFWNFGFLDVQLSSGSLFLVPSSLPGRTPLQFLLEGSSFVGRNPLGHLPVFVKGTLRFSCLEALLILLFSERGGGNKKMT